MIRLLGDHDQTGDAIGSPTQPIEQAPGRLGAKVNGSDVLTRHVTVTHTGHGDHLADVFGAITITEVEVINSGWGHARAHAGDAEPVDAAEAHGALPMAQAAWACLRST